MKSEFVRLEPSQEMHNVFVNLFRINVPPITTVLTFSDCVLLPSGLDCFRAVYSRVVPWNNSLTSHNYLRPVTLSHPPHSLNLPIPHLSIPCSCSTLYMTQKLARFKYFPVSQLFVLTVFCVSAPILSKPVFFSLPLEDAHASESLCLSASLIHPPGATPLWTRASAFRRAAFVSYDKSAGARPPPLQLQRWALSQRELGGQRGYQWQAAPFSHYWEAWIAPDFSRDHWHGVFLGLPCCTEDRPVISQYPLFLSSNSATIGRWEWWYDGIQQPPAS